MSPPASRNLPGWWAGNSPEGCPSTIPIRSCSRWGLPCRSRCRSRGGLLPHRFTLAPPVVRLRRAPRPAEPNCRRGGLISVALSLGSPPPVINRHRVSMEPGLSSPAAFRLLLVRPPGRLAARIKAFALQIANENPAGSGHATSASKSVLRPKRRRDTAMDFLPATFERRHDRLRNAAQRLDVVRRGETQMKPTLAAVALVILALHCRGLGRDNRRRHGEMFRPRHR